MSSPSSPGTWVTSSTFIQAAAHLSGPATGSAELKLESLQRITSSGEKGQYLLRRAKFLRNLMKMEVSENVSSCTLRTSPG